MVRKLLIFLLFNIHLSYAITLINLKDKRLEIKTRTEETKLIPSISQTFLWNKKFFSYINIDASYFSKNRTIQGFNSKVNTSYTQNLLEIGIINYSFNNFSVGVGTGYYSINKEEFGYIDINNTFTAFENNIKFKIIRYFLDLSFRKNFNTVLLYIGGKIYGSANSSLKQETFFKPLVNDSINTTHNLSIKNNYRLEGVLSIPVNKFVISIMGSYEYLPVYYNFYVLNNNGSSYNFVKEKVDGVQEEYSYGFYLSFPIMDKSMFFGYLKSLLKDKGSNKDNSSQYITFGFLF